MNISFASCKSYGNRYSRYVKHLSDKRKLQKMLAYFKGVGLLPPNRYYQIVRDTGGGGHPPSVLCYSHKVLYSFPISKWNVKIRCAPLYTLWHYDKWHRM